MFLVSLNAFSDINEEVYYYPAPVVGHYLFLECEPDPNWADFSDGVIKGLIVYEKNEEFFIQFFFVDSEEETHTLYLDPFKLIQTEVRTKQGPVSCFLWERTSVAIFFLKDEKTDDIYIVGKDMSEEPDRQKLLLILYQDFEEKAFEGE
jgi:hypothetical protein